MERKWKHIAKQMGIFLLAGVMLCSVTGCSLLTGLSENERNTGYLNGARNDYAHKHNHLFSDTVVRNQQTEIKGDGTDQVTVLIYMNGSNLESDSKEATNDIAEIVRAGSSDRVNILMQTMGTKSWSKESGIASDRSQIYKVNGSGLSLVKDDLGQLDCTRSDTLSDFIIWGAQNYPANRYILMFWNHGGGPVYGFGYDEWQGEEEALTIDEMQTALNTAGVYFDFIGMDCCIMSCMEVCCALYDYCDYMVLSEDFESGLGWYYTDWLQQLYGNTSIPTQELAKYIVDGTVEANASDKKWGSESILALIDESMMKVLYTAWMDFAYANEAALLNKNYSRKVTKSSRALPRMQDKGFFSDWLSDDSADDDYTMSDYYITDIMSVASNINSEESAALSSAVNQAVVYMNSTSGDANLTGLSVTLPYGDSSFYYELQKIFINCGFDTKYIEWLGKFTKTDKYNDFYNYDVWDSGWSGWDNYKDAYNWKDWDYYDNQEYWDNGFRWNSWNFLDSWNYWWNDDDWSCSDDDWSYDGSDWYYGDSYSCDDDWYGDGCEDDWDSDYYCYDDWYDDDYWYSDDCDDGDYDDDDWYSDKDWDDSDDGYWHHDDDHGEDHGNDWYDDDWYDDDWYDDGYGDDDGYWDDDDDWDYWD